MPVRDDRSISLQKSAAVCICTQLSIFENPRAAIWQKVASASLASGSLRQLLPRQQKNALYGETRREARDLNRLNLDPPKVA